MLDANKGDAAAYTTYLTSGRSAGQELRKANNEREKKYEEWIFPASPSVDHSRRSQASSSGYSRGPPPHHVRPTVMVRQLSWAGFEEPAAKRWWSEKEQRNSYTTASSSSSRKDKGKARSQKEKSWYFTGKGSSGSKGQGKDKGKEKGKDAKKESRAGQLRGLAEHNASCAARLFS